MRFLFISQRRVARRLDQQRRRGWKSTHSFRGDVFALKTVVDAFAPQASPAFDEIQKQPLQ